jgi:ElaB/YqjD/DUF883 family membrane-anchored ribosome-binding protein
MNNNPRFNPSGSQSPDALQSDIDTTRQRMDDTIDALSSRLKGRHLIDELIGFFRSSEGDGNGNAAKLKEKVTSTANTALHSVVDTVKAHPLPTLLIGAGIAWMLIQRRREASYSGYEYDPDYEARRAAGYGASGWEDDVPYDYTGSSAISSDISGSPSAYGGGMQGEGSGKFEQMKHQLGDKASAAGEHLRERGSEIAARTRQTAHELSERVQAGYSVTRRRVVTTVEQHPLESAVASLALGVVAGLLIPAPRALRERIAPAATRLREQVQDTGHDLVERGKHVAEAAVKAVKDEAEEQGLTADALKHKAEAVADRAREATKEAADKEGLNPTHLGQSSGGSSASGTPSTSGAKTPKSPPAPTASSSGF